MNETIPAISVIIPMYNAEKYIRQCLDSALNQEFKDFEIIVVDDCSTDRSASIVDDVIQTHTHKGAASLRLLRLPENSGGAATPRNVGIRLASGKYVTFLDSDDMIAAQALQVMFNAAERFKADVVHVDKFFLPTGTGDQINASTKMTLQSYQSGAFVDKPTLETEDIAQRVVNFCQRKYIWWACNKLFRRNLLIENQIEFADARSVEDMIFAFCCLCCAKNYVRIPDVFYVYRQNPNSITHSTLTLEQQIKRYVPSLARGVKALDKFIDRQRFFREHPELKLMAINFLMELHMGGEAAVYSKFPPHLIEPLIRKEFANEKGDGSEIIMTYLFSLVNTMRLQLIKSQEDLNKSQAAPASEQVASSHQLLRIN